MTLAVAGTLLALALVDGSFSGFRSSVGRTGLIRHRASDLIAARRGATLAGVLLAPMIAFVIGDVITGAERLPAYTDAGAAMLVIYLPYACVVVAALAAYALLDWRLKYLASAVILGPCTLLRPSVAVLGCLAAVIISRDPVVVGAAIWSVSAVLAVEPLANRRWYAAENRPNGLATRRPR